MFHVKHHAQGVSSFLLELLVVHIPEEAEETHPSAWILGTFSRSLYARSCPLFYLAIGCE
jgi:hypothetical protein